MSWTHLRDSNLKSRKAHVCSLCGKMIEAGTIYVRRCGVLDGVFCDDAMHVACEEQTKNWDAMDWETFGNGDLELWAREMQ